MADVPAKMLAPALPAERAKTCALSFTAGYVDTSVFVGLFGLFTAHVTGNFVLIGSELVHASGDVWPKLLAFPAFILAVAAAVKVAEALERRHQAPVPILLYIEAALLLAAFAAVAARHPGHATDASALMGGMLAAAAMGMQNAMMRIELAALPSTTVMTVNVTQSVIDVVTMLSRSDAARRDEARRRFSRMWPPLAAFTAGAAGGALGYALVGFSALLIPSALCLVLGALWRRGH
jgi:uncharacterized membrane protein YoaK (UPF0700 family)